MWKLQGAFALVALLMCSTTWAELPGFSSYIFDGSSFREARGAGAILVKDGMLPQTAGAGDVREDPLPAGTGAVAVLCYRQSSGGKLKSHAAAAPMPGIAVTVRGSGLILATRTNAGGYAILALPPGSYEVSIFGFTKRVVVDSGKTVLTSIRGSKRMVD